MEIKIKYFTDAIERLRYIDGKSDWIDLRAAQEVALKAGEFALIPLGIAMQLPAGYEAHVVPRSSLSRQTAWASLTRPTAATTINGFSRPMRCATRSFTSATASVSSVSWSTSPQSPSLSPTRWATPTAAVTAAPARPKPSVTLCAARAYTAV